MLPDHFFREPWRIVQNRNYHESPITGPTIPWKIIKSTKWTPIFLLLWKRSLRPKIIWTLPVHQGNISFSNQYRQTSTLLAFSIERTSPRTSFSLCRSLITVPSWKLHVECEVLLLLHLSGGKKKSKTGSPELQGWKFFVHFLYDNIWLHDSSTYIYLVGNIRWTHQISNSTWYAILPRGE